MVDGDETLDPGERASLLNAAANARSNAMLTGTHGVVAPPLDAAVVQLMVRAQQPIDRRLAGHVAPGVCQPGHDLRGR